MSLLLAKWSLKRSMMPFFIRNIPANMTALLFTARLDDRALIDSESGWPHPYPHRIRMTTPLSTACPDDRILVLHLSGYPRLCPHYIAWQDDRTLVQNVSYDRTPVHSVPGWSHSCPQLVRMTVPLFTARPNDPTVSFTGNSVLWRQLTKTVHSVFKTPRH